MQITGQLVEIGRLEEESGADGIVIRRDDDSLVTIKGMEGAELMAMSAFVFERVTVTVAAA